jgi:hypothetical protein
LTRSFYKCRRHYLGSFIHQRKIAHLSLIVKGTPSTNCSNSFFRAISYEEVGTVNADAHVRIVPSRAAFTFGTSYLAS